MREDRREDIQFSVVATLLHADCVSISPHEISKRNALKSLWIRREFVSVGLEFNLSGPHLCVSTEVE